MNTQRNNAEGTSGPTSKGGSKKGRKLKTLTAIKKKTLFFLHFSKIINNLWINFLT